MSSKIIIITVVTLFIATMVLLNCKNVSQLPIVAIANYGPHPSLDDTIKGIKDELASLGFKDKENIQIKIAEVGFDLSFIPQMVTQLKSQHPAVMVVVGTPIAQFAKNAVREIPVVFSVVTDPVEAGLLKEAKKSHLNMTGASDKQDLGALLMMAKKLIPNATKVGILYATGEANDITLVKMLKRSAKQYHMDVVAIPVDQARDVPFAMQRFKEKVDFIYVGGSGAIQPTLPAIVAEADKLRIPILNFNEKAVFEQQVLASFGVNYHQVGSNTGQIVGRILQGEKIANIAPLYPTIQAHHGFLSRSQANKHNLAIPSDLANITVVE